MGEDSPVSSPTPEPGAATGGLLERSRELSTLGAWLEDAHETSHGRFVFLAGEAGLGKTALLRALCAEHGRRARVLWGACDPMVTPQPLGPLLDVAETTGGETARLVAAGAKPHPIAAALLRELAAPAPTLLVIEDLHWADEATLDVLGLLARRIGSVPALVLASYRDDELDRHGPLRILLGELATAEDVRRMLLAALSMEAVATLAAPHRIDADALYRTTDGNAFFVTQVLAGGQEQIPPTVRDAVLARTARLSPGGRNVLDAAAVLLPPVELAILNAVAPDADGGLEECLTARMLVATTGGVAFRHELSRLAEGSLSPDAKVALHSQALAALAARPDSHAETALMAHHAEGAGDAGAVLRFAPAAARAAAAAGAHREAAAQYDRALRFSSAAPLRERAELLDHRTAECTLIGEFRGAIASGREALECWQQLGDRREEGRALTALAWPHWVLGAKEEAEAIAHRAIAVLKEGAPGPELIQAYLRLSISAHGGEALDAAVSWATRGLEVAEQLDDQARVVEARVQIAAADFMRHRPGAREELERMLALARREGLEHAAAYAFCYLTRAAIRIPDYALAARYIDEGIVYCTEHDLYGFRPYLIAVRSGIELGHGQWAEAAESAGAVIAGRGAGLGTVLALATLGRVRARRGDPAQWEPLDEALRLAEPSGEIGRLGPVAMARAEAAWLEGRFEAAVEATESAIELARRYDASLALGELALWRRRAGLDEPVPAGAAEPYATQLGGDSQTAAARWIELGAPYDAALALADGDDEDALRRALDEVQRLGAEPAAAIVARRLRSRGARGLPRGPRARTRGTLPI
jgi:tetratricopeptide (TPR) repeat protein